MSLINKLPTALPKDTTPNTYSGTGLRTFIIPADVTVLIPQATITNAAAVLVGAVTMQLSSAENVALPSGTVLTFGTASVTTAEDVELTNAASAVAIVAAPTAVPAGTMEYTNLVELPLAEESNPNVTDSEETIPIYGRYTPIRSINGKDMTSDLTTLAGLDDPIVARLMEKGYQLSPNNRERLLWYYPDGLALLATVNIGAPMRTATPGNTMRTKFTANLAGKLMFCFLTKAVPVWESIGGGN